jgi:FixJ family two-component response regulator
MEPVLHDRSDDDYDPMVLVIDDDPDVREGLRALFESVNLQSKAFGSAWEFFQSRLLEKVSCLVLDVRLPGLSGLDLQIELAKIQVNIPIIFITGHGDIPMSVKAIRAGAVEFLTKPFREQDLLDAVGIALDRDRKQREHDKRIHNLRIRFGGLSRRERKAMTLVAAGLMSSQVATEIGVSKFTVKAYRRNIIKKLDAKSFPDLVRMADTLGLRHRTRTNGPRDRDSKTAFSYSKGLIHAISHSEGMVPGMKKNEPVTLPAERRGKTRLHPGRPRTPRFSSSPKPDVKPAGATSDETRVA